jgi:drug/metabolite transporter (DMT)-like permease
LTSEIVAQNPRTELGVLAVNLAQLPFLWVGAFGSWGLGWLDTEMPAIVWAAAAGVAVSILFFALGKSSRTRVWTAAAIGGLTALIPLYVLQRSLSYVGEQVQPRYILPLMILCAGVLLLSLERSDVSLTRPQGLLAALALSAASAMALFVNIKRYVAGINTASGVNLNADMQWWWNMAPTPMARVGDRVASACRSFSERFSHRAHASLTLAWA